MVLAERYEVGEFIARGSMAMVYRGCDLCMERPVAIKVLREVYSTNPLLVTRFQRGVKFVPALQHPNIVQVYDYGQTEGYYFIVMALVEGTDLRRYLRSRGTLTVERAMIIAHDVALGVGTLHRHGIVHCDVRPDNILVGRDGTIRLTPFGSASIYANPVAEQLTVPDMSMELPGYTAPEQLMGQTAWPTADVYALGILMYQMLTGRLPFDADHPVGIAMQHIHDIPLAPSSLNPTIPPALEEIIMRCLEKDPEKRFQDGHALARALDLLDEEGF